MKALKAIAAGVIALTLTACQDGSGPKQQVGTLLGAVGGAVAGAQIGKGHGRDVGIAAGTLLGALLGSEIGKSLDRADMAYLQQTQQKALETTPSGTTSKWSNPDSGNSGQVTPQRTYQRTDGTYCREFQQTVTVGGNSESAYGTACRQPDGTWKIVNT
jgi:surface antigen